MHLIELLPLLSMLRAFILTSLLLGAFNASTMILGEETPEQKVIGKMDFMANNLALNDPSSFKSGGCVDNWGRMGSVDPNETCSHIQILKMSNKNGIMKSTQFLNLNPYTPSFWNSVPNELLGPNNTREHYRSVHKSCIDSARNQKFATYTTWTRIDGELYLMLVYCCTPKKCMDPAYNKAEALIFPQCARGKPSSISEGAWTTASDISDTKGKRDAGCIYTESVSWNSTNVGFMDLNRCGNIEDEGCFLRILPVSPQSVERYACCMVRTTSTPELNTTHEIWGSVYSPTGQAILMFYEFRDQIASQNHCVGYTNNVSKKCYLYFDVMNSIFQGIFKKGVNEYIHGLILKYMTKGETFCIVDNDSASVDQVKKSALGKRKDTSPIFVCEMRMRLRENGVEVKRDAGSFVNKTLGIKNNFQCAYTDDAQTEVVCGCRPSYNGSKPFCNENPAFFGDYYDKLRGKLVRPAALLRTFADELEVCGVKRGNSTAFKDALLQTVGFRTKTMCYFNSTAGDVNMYNENPKKIRLYTHNEPKAPYDVLSEIVCRRSIGADVMSRLEHGCSCLIVELPTRQAYLPICCCSPYHMLKDEIN